jgi:hypothetical protein
MKAVPAVCAFRLSSCERFPGMEINIMLIIDYLDEGNMPAEKPNHRAQPVVAQRVGLRKGPGTLDPQYRWAQDQQRNLQQVAQNARLLKLAKNSGDSQK